MSKRNPLLAFRLHKDLLAGLKTLAKADKVSLPEYMRSMVRQRVLGRSTGGIEYVMHEHNNLVAELEKKP